MLQTEYAMMHVKNYVQRIMCAILTQTTESINFKNKYFMCKKMSEKMLMHCHVLFILNSSNNYLQGCATSY